MSQLPRIPSPKSVEEPAQQSHTFADVYASDIGIRPQVQQLAETGYIPFKSAIVLRPYDYDNDLMGPANRTTRLEIEDLRALAGVLDARGDSSLKDALGAVAQALANLSNVTEIANAMTQGSVVEISADTETGEITAEGSG